MTELRAPGRRFWAFGGMAWACLALLGCGERKAFWDLPATSGEPIGLRGAVAIPDLPRNELLMLTSPGQGELNVTRLPVGQNIVAAVPSRDLEHLYVLTRGQQRRVNEADEKPRLSVFKTGVAPALEQTYSLEDPAQKITLDPQGDWAVVYDSGGVVVNVNEFVLVDLAHPDRAPIPKTIRSTGGRPEQFTFTTALQVPGSGPHRFLVVETDQDVAVMDLEAPEAPEVTAPVPSTTLPGASQGKPAHPAQVVYVDASEETPAYLAVRFANDASVMTLELAEGATSAHAFSLRPNLLDAGDVASTIDFVQTDHGLRLAVLVPNRSQAVLIDPTTSRSEKVQFGAKFAGMARITGLSGEDEGTADVALLYGPGTSSIAFWRLGDAGAAPYASFDLYGTSVPVASIMNVPGNEYGYMKLLLSSDGVSFSLLDLKSRLSYAMQALQGFNVSFSPDGERVWAYPQYSPRFARLNLSDKHPTSYDVELPVTRVFEVNRADGGKSALVLHGGSGDWGVTLFDADRPDSAQTTFKSGLILEGI
ncbi:MAG TPA: hypothetical protein VFQ61_27455 [Polyangiaceae bacterium]|nr:hypothetical protein [Polyangiaceae bacterium]